MEHAKDIYRESETDNYEEIPIDETDELRHYQELEAEAAEASSELSAAPVSEGELELLRTRNEQLMRIAADFENYKRRHVKEKEDWAKFAGQQVITNLLPVIDNFERAFQTELKPEEFENFVEGMRMIHRQFLEALHKAGVSPVEAMGEPFNPEFHEAIMSEPNDEVPDETVIAEFQKGYLMNGRLLRPTIVKVSKSS